MGDQTTFVSEKKGAYTESRGERPGSGALLPRHGAQGFHKKNQIVVKHPSIAQRSAPMSAGGKGQDLDPTKVTYSLLGPNGEESGSSDATVSSNFGNSSLDISRDNHAAMRNGSLKLQAVSRGNHGVTVSPTSQRINAIKDSAERIRSTLQKHSKDHEEARKILSRPSMASSGS